MHSKQKGTFPTTPRILAAFLMAFFLMVSCGCSTKIGQPVLPDSEGNGSETETPDENKPGEMHFVFIWESLESWKKVDDKELQAAFIKEFESKFTKPYEFIYCGQNEENFGVHRYSRFERVDD